MDKLAVEKEATETYRYAEVDELRYEIAERLHLGNQVSLEGRRVLNKIFKSLSQLPI
jgi:hypothetical protein